MSRRLHQRVVSFTYYDEDLPYFKTNEELDEWHRALGRLVAYGLRRSGDAEEDLVQLVSLLTRGKDEVDACYWTPVPARQLKYSDGTGRYMGSHEEMVTKFVRRMQEASEKGGRPYVMGAVKDADGTFGFHS